MTIYCRYWFEWSVPEQLRSLPVAEAAQAVVDAWRKFFQLLDAQTQVDALAASRQIPRL